MANGDVQFRFGNTVKAFRSELGISQEELAGRSGLHRTYISDIERGARNVSLKAIEKLAIALETSISALFPYRSWDFPEGTNQSLATQDGQEVSILLVEDSSRDIELTLEAFKAARITNPIYVRRDGKEGLDFVHTCVKYAPNGTKTLPLLILLDLNLPKVNGLEMLRKLKAQPKTRSLPVIILTISKNDKDIAECKRLGADNYLVKPVDFHGFSKLTPQFDFRWSLLRPVTSIGR
jgi:two-component system, response regulator